MLAMLATTVTAKITILSRRRIEPRRGGRGSRDGARAFFALVARAFLFAMALGFRFSAGWF